MNGMRNFFAEPGMIVIFVKDSIGARFCQVEDDEVQLLTSVALRRGQLVEVDKKQFRNIGYAFKEESGNHQVAYIELEQTPLRIMEAR